MHLLSSVRLGINLGLIDDLEIATVNELFILTQPAHLQRIQKVSADVDERNMCRATYLRNPAGPGQRAGEGRLRFDLPSARASRAGSVRSSSLKDPGNARSVAGSSRSAVPGRSGRGLPSRHIGRLA